MTKKDILTRLSMVGYDSDFPFTPSMNKKKYIFIHVPKCAGSAIRSALGEPKYRRRHLPWWVYKTANKKKFDNYYKFAVVRNPVERLLSGYNYFLAGGNANEDLVVANRLKEYSGFSEFVLKGLRHGFYIYHPIFRPQSYYLTDYSGQVMVDYVARYENLREHYTSLADTLGLDLILDEVNVSKIKQDTGSLSSEVMECIYELYAHDFQCFGYDTAKN